MLIKYAMWIVAGAMIFLIGRVYEHARMRNNLDRFIRNLTDIINSGKYSGDKDSEVMQYKLIGAVECANMLLGQL